MPAFNAERYIDEALASVCAQTLEDIEVIVVDDGSKDSTIARARAFTSKLDLMVLQQPNGGPSAARNVGIRRARGRYCAFLDADDVMLPELLVAQAAVLDADADVGLVCTDIVTFDDSGTLKDLYWNLAATRDPFDRLLLENFVTTSAVMSPTTRLLEAGLFPEHRRVAEDYELWLKLAKRWKIAMIERPLVRYRYASGSLSADRLFSALCALEVIEEFWRDAPELRRMKPRTYRRSLSRHTANAGVAALREGKRATALRYLARALRNDPAAIGAWKGLAKSLLPARRSSHSALLKAT
jgi:glycosyltransferase involved in cell wall biosynthesis